MRRNRVYEVSNDLWMLGIGYTATNGVVDDLGRYLADGGAAEETTASAMEDTG